MMPYWFPFQWDGNDTNAANAIPKTEDVVMTELRRNREALSERFNNDPAAFVAFLQSLHRPVVQISESSTKRMGKKTKKRSAEPIFTSEEE